MIDLIRETGHLWLSEVFIVLLTVSIVVYTILDGYDLGIGILIPYAGDEKHRDIMFGTIAPFWDSNETWLILVIGVLFIAFPNTYNLLMHVFYIPIFCMIFALILRGISFDFRAKVAAQYKKIWTILFFIGSLGTAFTQGYMLGLCVMGLSKGFWQELTAILSGIFLIFSYALIGSAWLVGKTDHQLQQKSVLWGKRLTSWILVILNIFLAQEIILGKDSPFIKILHANNHGLSSFILILINILAIATFYGVHRSFSQFTFQSTKTIKDWMPFICVALLFMVSIILITYLRLLYPSTIVLLPKTTSDPYSLFTVLVGAIIVLPLIIAYNIYVHFVFKGKMHNISY